MKIVFDTNVIIAAFMTQGYCHEIVEYACEKHQVIVSPYILNELEKKLVKKLRFQQKDVRKIIGYLNEHCTLASRVQKLSQPASRDKTDDPVIAVAFQENVHALFSGDNDLLVLKKYQYIPILAPKAFWEYESQQLLDTHTVE
ncbi:MAG: putative toxin-antitoxin system toxin component, PIN family [Candidatus Kerfeldbacteria bacterium]|nr:putative toxin-antitoxin system toxin component, PIN family [Candidatus Kerfeldbacteria bacterium]